MKKILILFYFITLNAQAINITYIADTYEITSYWQNVYNVAQAAAQDLAINLTLLKGGGQRTIQAELIAKISKYKNKPDLLIFTGYQRNAFATFSLLEQAKIPFITLSRFDDTIDLLKGNELGYPQEKFKYWLAEHYDDHFQGGFILTNSLINLSKQTQDKQLKMLVINGDFTAQSKQKSLGVIKRIKQDKQVTLVQDIVAHWQFEGTKTKLKHLYKRHKGIDIVLAGSDSMAIAALEGAIEIGLKPNQNIFIGGFDWDKQALNKIEQNQLSASAGGHFFSIGWLLIKVYDHFNHQKVFQGGKQQASVDFTVIDKNNFKEVKQLVNNDYSSINFYCFSKAFTQNAVYNFSLSTLLTHLESINETSCLKPGSVQKSQLFQ